ncbi:MAG: UDP-glucose:undecaprenyl-phosphate glucose-1-phosphate transferase [bacterium ADurb.Bin212]|nr:MAG: UDP-glucose:undecaprenyl-phosphate glucose-1-phosphate transferase [bacterium ADurb.Bin212]
MKKIELFFTFIMLPVDIAMVMASFVLGYSLRGSLDLGQYIFVSDISSYLILSVYSIPVVIIVYATQGLYDNRLFNNMASVFYRIFISNSVVMSLIVLSLFFSKNSEFSRIILGSTWLISLALVFIGRYLVRSVRLVLIKNNIGRKNTVIVGTNDLAKLIAKQLKKHYGSGYKFLGYLSVAGKDKESKVMGGVNDYKDIFQKNTVEEIVICESFAQELSEEMLVYCADHNIAVKYTPILAPSVAIKAYPYQLGLIQMLEIRTTPLNGWGRIIKRILDFTFALILLVFLMPLFLLIAAIQKATTQGPVFYSHERIGRDKKRFTLYKFRSMYHQAEIKENRYWTKENDTRITPLGRILRKTNLDELPQLYNILKGDMSFVGPRPEQPKFVEEFSKEIPNYPNRHRVKSGLTGWAQVNGLKGDTSISERVRYDIYYVENWSIWLDLKIIALTIVILIYELVKGKYEYSTGS